MFSMPELNLQTSSIYEFSLPTQDDRIDLCRLSRGGERFANEWCDQLRTTGRATSTIEVPFRTAKWLRHLYTESKNMEQLKGTRPLGLGFPIVQFTYKSQVIASPLLIWQLQLDAVANKNDTWNIRHEQGQNLRFNPFLTRLFQEKFDVDLPAELQTPNGIDWGRMEELFVALNFDIADSATIVPCPTEKNGLAQLLWSGIVGLYPQTTISSPQRLFPQASNRKEESLEEHNFGLQILGKYQAAAFDAILRNTYTNVKGTYGTGKTHLITHLLSNALSNGKCCLVLSDSVPMLKKTQRKFERLGLENLNFLLKDEYNDPLLLLEVLRSSDIKKDIPEFEQESFQLLLNRCLRNQRKLEQYQDMVNSHVFGGKTWTETVGEFLRNNRIEGKERLTPYLNPQEFEFTYEEYAQLLEAIRTCAGSYSKVATLKHPLKNLNAGIFSASMTNTGAGFVQQTVQLFLDKAYQLQNRFIQKTSTYQEHLREYYERFYQQFITEAIALQELLIDARGQYGEELDTVSARSFSTSFSRRKREISDFKEQTASRYANLVRQFEEKALFNFQFLPDLSTTTSLEVIDNLGEFEYELNRWIKHIDEQVYDETKRLSSKTVQSGVDFQEQIEELEYALDVFTAELNESKLYHMSAENKMLTIPKRQKYLESLIEQLENTRFHIRDYELFSNWQQAWLQRSNLEQRIVQALMKVRSQHWEEAFTSWYLYHCLAKAHDPAIFIHDSTIIEELANDNEVLKPLLVRQIQAFWHFYHEDKRKDLRRDAKKVYQYLFSKRQNTSATLEEVQVNIGAAFSAVSSYIPVIFATPEAAASFAIIPEGGFDYLIIEDTQGNVAQKYASYFKLAQKIVTISDDNVQQQGVSVADLLEKRGAVSVALQQLQSKTVSHLQHFKSVIQQNELPALAKYDETENLSVIHVGGRFNEKDGANDVEARELIRQLNTIQQTPQRRYPSVGIVCFTTGQRDLIVSYLSDLRRKTGNAKKLIQALDRNGLGVFRADELHGQRFDIVLLSTTFGIADIAGNLTKQAQQLADNTGEQLLRLVLGSVEKECRIINSIPDTELVKFANDKERKGLYLLANLIEYANAVQREDEALQKELLDFFETEQLEEEHDFSSLFIAEVAEALRPYFEKDRVQENVLVDRSAQRLPLVVQAAWDDKWKTAIYPEGLLENSAIMDYSSAYQKQVRLHEDGYLYHPIWSVDWWKNPKREARKLASKLIKQYTK